MSEALGNPRVHHLWLSPVPLNLQLSQHVPLSNWQHLTETQFSRLLDGLPGRSHWGSGCSTTKTTKESLPGDWNTYVTSS